MTGRKAIIALVLAMMLALPLAGSALAKPLIVDDFADELTDIQEAIGEPAEDSERAANHGWYVSQLASDFDQLMVDAGVDPEGLNRGKWISMFARWMAPGGEEITGALDDEDDENEESGRENAPGQSEDGPPGQAKKVAAAGESDLNPGQAKKAERAED